MKKVWDSKKKYLKMVLLLVLMMSFLCLAGCAKKEAEHTKIGALKGPTSMGILNMLEEDKVQKDKAQYEFTMATAADELTALIAQEKLDIALLPANVASILYQKTKGEICVIDVNTLGVLYMVSGNDDIQGLDDIKGRTVYLTGKGTTPEYVFRHLMEQRGISDTDCTLEFKSEAAEIVALLAQDTEAVGILPQPFVTAACIQNEKLKKVVSLEEEWNQIYQNQNRMVTGVTIVRKAFLEQYPDSVKQFLEEHKKSVEALLGDVEKGASLCVEQGIVAKEPIAKKAIPDCNIVCLTGVEMKSALEGYLQILFESAKETVGGTMPDQDFYYIP